MTSLSQSAGLNIKDAASFHRRALEALTGELDHAQLDGNHLRLLRPARRRQGPHRRRPRPGSCSSNVYERERRLSRKEIDAAFEATG